MSEEPDRIELLASLARAAIKDDEFRVVTGVTWSKDPTVFDEVSGALLSGALGMTAPFLVPIGRSSYCGFLALSDSTLYFGKLHGTSVRVRQYHITEPRIASCTVSPEACSITLRFPINEFLSVSADPALGPQNAESALLLAQLQRAAAQLDKSPPHFSPALWATTSAKILSDPPTIEKVLRPHQEQLKRIRRVALECVQCRVSKPALGVPHDLLHLATAKNGYVKFARVDALGFACSNCHRSLCQGCMKQVGMKFSWWSGFAKTKCHICSGLFNPETYFLPVDRPDLVPSVRVILGDQTIVLAG